MRFACSITKTTDTHLEYVILIAFPRKQWLRECGSVLTFVRTFPLLFNVESLVRRRQRLCYNLDVIDTDFNTLCNQKIKKKMPLTTQDEGLCSTSIDGGTEE